MSTISASTTTTTAFKITTDTTGTLVFQTGSTPTTAVTIDGSGKLLLNTTSLNTYTANINGTLGVYGGNGLFLQNASNNAAVAIYNGGGTGVSQIQFNTSGSERMRLDASGNLGLGVTPSAWGGSYKALDINSYTAVYGASGNDSGLTQNCFYNGTNWIYKNTNAASRYLQSGGQHQWQTAASGTAGNAISFTQAMTLDASGNLLVGTTGITGGLNGNVINLFGSGTVRNIVQTTGQYSVINMGSGGTSTSPATTGYLLTDSSANTFGVYTGSSTPLLFGTNGSERARIDSSGVLLVNRTSYSSGIGSSCKFQVLGTVGEWTSVFENSSGTTPYGIVVKYSGTNPSSTNYPFFYASDTVGARFYVPSNGGVYNYSANNVNLSDRREKTNFAPAGDYLAKICAIPVQTFNYVDQNMEEDGDLTLGVVAQDVQAVAPELVTESDWSVKKDGSKMRLSIYQTDLQYALMKAVQELNTRLEALESK